jgi:hypothetical protein
MVAIVPSILIDFNDEKMRESLIRTNWNSRAENRFSIPGSMTMAVKGKPRIGR